MVVAMDETQTDRRVVLGVQKSASSRVWRERLDSMGLAQALAIAQRTDLPEVLGRVLAGRDVPLQEASQFLSPSLKALMPDPSLLTDMDKGRCARGRCVAGWGAGWEVGFLATMMWMEPRRRR